MDDAKLISKRKSSVEFTEIPLEGRSHEKLPKRRVYFSDGYLDEYSTDDEVDSANKETQPLIDPKTLTWVPYIWYMTWWIGSKALSVCDYLGEHLAYFLGITAPKFQYEMEQYKKLLEEEELLKKRIASENAGWNSTSTITEPVEVKPVPSQLSFSSDPSTIPPAEESTDKTVDSRYWLRY